MKTIKAVAGAVLILLVWLSLALVLLALSVGIVYGVMLLVSMIVDPKWFILGFVGLMVVVVLGSALVSLTGKVRRYGFKHALRDSFTE
jgi:uncharacterized protein (DUF58 family)